MDLRRSGLPNRFWEREIAPHQDVKQWLSELEEILVDLSSPVYGQGLVITGPASSEQAAYAFREYMNAANLGSMVDRGYFADFWKWAESVKAVDGRAEIVESTLLPVLLVFDQVSLSRSEFLTATLTGVLKSRFDLGRPTIITSSKPLETVRPSLASCLDFDPSVVRFVETLASEG